MTPRPSTAAPILAVLAIVLLVMLAIYVTAYYLTGEYIEGYHEQTRAPVTCRLYRYRWQRTVFSPVAWAEMRLLVTALPSPENAWRLRVELLRCRGGFGGGAAEVEVNHEADDVCVVSELADPARAAGKGRAG